MWMFRSESWTRREAIQVVFYSLFQQENKWLYLHPRSSSVFISLLQLFSLYILCHWLWCVISECISQSPDGGSNWPVWTWMDISMCSKIYNTYCTAYHVRITDRLPRVFQGSHLICLYLNFIITAAFPAVSSVSLNVYEGLMYTFHEIRGFSSELL